MSAFRTRLILIATLVGLISIICGLEIASAAADFKKCLDEDAVWDKCQGTYVLPNGDSYEGLWYDNQPSGKGILLFSNGRRYEGRWDGEWFLTSISGGTDYTHPSYQKTKMKRQAPHSGSQQKRNGQGIRTFPTGETYVGEFKDDKFNGKGTYILGNGTKYVGEFKDGKRSGQGTVTYKNGEKYTGEFNGDERNGWGTYTFADGTEYVGEFKNDHPNGHGKWTFIGGTYVGEFKVWAFFGQGTFTFSSGDQYVGAFRGSKRNGVLLVDYANGDKFSGNYNSDKRDGQGTYIWRDGTKYIGQWKDGLPTDGVLASATGAIITGAKYSSLATYNDRGNMTLPDLLTYSGGAAQQQQSQLNAQVAPSVIVGHRVAMVVGINDYENLPQLQKAVNDSRAVSKELADIGYDVISVENPDRRTLNRKLSELQSKIQPGDNALFYFAGHGVSLGADNILIAADMPEPESGDEDLVRDEGFSVDDIVRRIQKQGAKTTLLVLDACRDNPFEASGTRSIGGTRGLEKIDTPSGVFVLYSAGIGQSALDRLNDTDADPNSVFTRKLLPALNTKGLTLTGVAKSVQKEVADLAETINHQQQPAYYDQIIGEVVINPQ